MSIPARRALALLLPFAGLAAALLSLSSRGPAYSGRVLVALEASNPDTPVPTPQLLWSEAGQEALRAALASAVTRAAGAPPATASAPPSAATLAEAFLPHLSWSATETPALFEIRFAGATQEQAIEGAAVAAAALERLFAPAPGDRRDERRRLKAVQAELSALSSRTVADPGTLAERRRVLVQGATDLAEQYGRARSARLDLEARWNALRQSLPARDSEWLDSPELAGLREERSRLEQRRDQLAVRFGPQWPEMKEVADQLALVEARLDEEAGRLAAEALASAEADYRQTLAQERALERSLRSQREELRALEERETRQDAQRARAQELEAERAALESRLASTPGPERPAGRARMVQAAESSGAPDGASIPARLAAGALLGALLALAALWVAERMDPTLSTPAQAEKALDAPLLALLPEVPGGLPPGLLRLESAPPPGTEGPIDPLAAAARGFRDLRTGLLLTRGGEPTRMILVTACRRGEGKTTVAAHLALALARRGARVLLIDGSLQRPRAHKLFQAPPGPGLVDALAGTVKLEEAVRETDEAGLWLMPAGDVNGGGHDLLDAASLRHLRDRLLLPGRFQHLVIDAGDVGTAASPERLAVACSGVLLVVRARRNVGGALRQAAATLRRHGAPYLAGVWIGAEPERGGAGLPVEPALAEPSALDSGLASPGRPPAGRSSAEIPARAGGAPQPPSGASAAPPGPALDPELARRLDLLKSRLGRSRDSR